MSIFENFNCICDVYSEEILRTRATPSTPTSSYYFMKTNETNLFIPRVHLFTYIRTICFEWLQIQRTIDNRVLSQTRSKERLINQDSGFHDRKHRSLGTLESLCFIVICEFTEHFFLWFCMMNLPFSPYCNYLLKPNFFFSDNPVYIPDIISPV